MVQLEPYCGNRCCLYIKKDHWSEPYGLWDRGVTLRLLLVQMVEDSTKHTLCECLPSPTILSTVSRYCFDCCLRRNFHHQPFPWCMIGDNFFRVGTTNQVSSEARYLWSSLSQLTGSSSNGIGSVISCFFAGSNVK